MNQRKKNFERKAFAAILSLALLIAAASLVYGATAKDLVIEYDFLTGTLTPKKRKSVNEYKLKAVKRFTVAKGKNVLFKIINFNRFSYKATITADFVVHNFNSNTPSQFSALTPSEEVEKETTPASTPTPEAVKTKPSAIEQLSDAIENLEKVKKLQVNLEEALYTAPSFCHLEIKKNKLLFEFLGVKSVEQSSNEEEAIKRCLELRNKAMKTFDDIINKEINKFGEVVKKLLNDLKDLSKLQSLKEIDEKLRSIGKKGMPRKLYQLENMIKEFKEKKYVDGIKTILDNIKQENFSVSLTVPTVDSDEVKITVKIEPIDKKKAQVFHQLKNPIIVKVKGGWKIDFSTGVFFHFNAQDITYWYDDVPNDNAGGKTNGDSNENCNENNTTMVILRAKENEKAITPVVGAMMHIYPRQTGKVKWSGIAFGLGTGEADKLSYYLGTGVMLGSKNRFLINAGVTAVKGESLLPKYEEKLGLEIERPADDVVIVKSDYKLRFFLSLTYNLAK